MKFSFEHMLAATQVVFKGAKTGAKLVEKHQLSKVAHVQVELEFTLFIFLFWPLH
jgi:hypothetical protein